MGGQFIGSPTFSYLYESKGIVVNIRVVDGVSCVFDDDNVKVGYMRDRRETIGGRWLAFSFTTDDYLRDGNGLPACWYLQTDAAQALLSAVVQ